jgi:hypothetical protein
MIVSKFKKQGKMHHNREISIRRSKNENIKYGTAGINDKNER